MTKFIEEINIESIQRTFTMFQDLWKHYEKISSELIASWRDILLNNYRFFEGVIPIMNDGANIFLKIWFPYGYNKPQESESTQSDP